MTKKKIWGCIWISVIGLCMYVFTYYPNSSQEVKNKLSSNQKQCIGDKK